MRVKDELKQEALLQATVKVVNEIGFASSSVARIAKEAGVSPATLYVYHKNKEELLVATYIAVKHKLGTALLNDFNADLPIRDILQQVWNNLFDFIRENRDLFHFAEQFSNSPFADLVDKSEVEQVFQPLVAVLQRGIEQKIIKNVHFDILAAYVFYPAFTLANQRLCSGFNMQGEDIETAFHLTWDAIKL